MRTPRPRSSLDPLHHPRAAAVPGPCRARMIPRTGRSERYHGSARLNRGAVELDAGARIVVAPRCLGHVTGGIEPVDEEVTAVRHVRDVDVLVRNEPRIRVDPP